MLVALRLMSPSLFDPAVNRRQLVSITILNAFTLAVACWCESFPQDSGGCRGQCLDWIVALFAGCIIAVLALSWRGIATSVLSSLYPAHVSSTYYGFCGTDVMLDTPLDGGMRNLICKRWLSPVSAPQQSDFASWLRFGEYPF